MNIERSESEKILSESDIVKVRQLVRSRALELRLSLVDQTKLVTAASEIARNTLIYGGGGSCTLNLVNNGVKRGIQLIFEDQGPGIGDIKKAFTDGFTSGGGLGLGLGGSKRLVDDFDLVSEPGKGTKISMTKWH